MVEYRASIEKEKIVKLGRLWEEQPTRSSRLEAYKEAKN